ALVGLTVTDDSILEMIEKREQAPQLPAMVFLEPEVKELADAQIYFDPKNEKAPKQIDLLLGTQGWRRFSLVNVANFIAANGDEARRVLALRIPAQRDRLELEEEAMQVNAQVALGDRMRAIPMAMP